ncbi:MAG: bifunctional demethylmenaquinone methyltransferase/2-methoxy-6-polyprenyl-1,4-benzoquinol methylase UbiE [Actinobacteria bacterium]|nr:bifunctional demethylmenaquinone methyltransferase/2-methoxy-6-polyprenyl-1,4-benzoquinol methylase UbiE [Actinomycetota bacterium]
MASHVGEEISGCPTTERVQTIFSTIAPRYDRFNRISSLGLDRSWRRRAVRYAGIAPADQVLDLAAGTGDLTMAILRYAEPAGLLSTDFVPEMLEVGEQKASRYQGETLVSFAVVDAQALPFHDDAYDVVTVGFGVRNMPDRAANFREVRRVLKPGGRYAVLEFSRPSPAPFRAVYHLYLRHVIPALGALLTRDRRAFEYLNKSIEAFPGRVALARELHEAGFSQVQWHTMTFGIVAVHIATK